MASGNPTSTCIPRVDGWLTDPRVWGVTSVVGLWTDWAIDLWDGVCRDLLAGGYGPKPMVPIVALICFLTENNQVFLLSSLEL